MSFICTQSFCYFGDDESMLENGSAPRIPHLTRVYDLCFFFMTVLLPLGARSYAATQPSTLPTYVLEKPWRLRVVVESPSRFDPSAHLSQELVPWNPETYPCSLEMTGPQLRLQG